MNKEHKDNQRIVLLTGDGLEHRYVANKLASELELAGIIVDHGKRVGILEKSRRLWRRYTVPQLFSRICLTLFRVLSRSEIRRAAKINAAFGVENCGGFRPNERLFHVFGVNTPKGVSTVSSLQPDILLIFGTSIVGKKVLSLPRRICLNMHTGISPHYRGCDCTFWPVHNEELHMLGATVHECTPSVDGGMIFGTERISVRRDDCLHTIFARCVKAGAKLYATTVKQMINSGAAGTAQDLTIGKEYKAFMKGVRAQWRAHRKIQAGLIRRYADRRPAPNSA